MFRLKLGQKRLLLFRLKKMGLFIKSWPKYQAGKPKNINGPVLKLLSVRVSYLKENVINKVWILRLLKNSS